MFFFFFPHGGTYPPLPSPSQALLKSKLRGESCSAPHNWALETRAKTGTGF